MGLPKLETKISAEQYLADELVRGERHEFVNGEVYAMAGANDRHQEICGNLFVKLFTHIRKSRRTCSTFMSEMKLRVKGDGFYYPDIFVACDKNPESPYYRENPVLVIEVCSPSTRQIDRRKKLVAYQQIPDVQEYVVVEQDKMHVEIHRRQPDGRWIMYFSNDSELDVEIEFTSVALSTNLDEIYDRVKFPAPVYESFGETDAQD